jgi:CRISPR/Cas system endoribonuclease Cas6 (RAMP superfamily)
MSIIFDSINRLQRLSFDKLQALMKDTYDLSGDRINYITSNIDVAISSLDYLHEKIFIAGLDNKELSTLHKKYFKVNPINMCHNKKYDTETMLTNLIYIDGMEELYNYLNNSISIYPDEFIFCFTVAAQTGIFDKAVKNITKKLKEENNAN